MSGMDKLVAAEEARARAERAVRRAVGRLRHQSAYHLYDPAQAGAPGGWQPTGRVSVVAYGDMMAFLRELEDALDHLADLGDDLCAIEAQVTPR